MRLSALRRDDQTVSNGGAGAGRRARRPGRLELKQLLEF